MSSTFEEALATTTAAELEATAIDDLATDGADVEGWDDFAPQRLLVVQHARARARAEELRRAAVLGGYLRRAAEAGDSWVDEALTWYATARIPASKAVWTFRLSCAVGAGPYTIGASSRALVAQADDATEFENTNPAAVTVASGSSILCQFTARKAGITGNQLAAAVTRLIVGKPGLTVTNDPSVGATLDTPARDAETNDQAIARAEGRWGTLAGILTASGWRYVMLTPEVGGVSTLTRLWVDDANPDGPGSVRIYVANASGPPTAGELAAAQTQAARYRIAGMGSVGVFGAASKAVSFSAVLATDGSNALAAAQAATAVQAYIAGLEGNTAFYFALAEALMSPAGVTNVQSFSLTGDVTKNSGEVFVVTPTITVV